MRNLKPNITIEDPLFYLPRRPLREYVRGRLIYAPDCPAAELSVVIQGRIKITNHTDDGGLATVRIVRREGIFGERCLIDYSSANESALALEDSMVMSWGRDEIEKYIAEEPRLGIALAQVMVRQCASAQDRIESMAVYGTRERVMLAMLQLGRQLGAPLPDGFLRVGALTHLTIAEFVGTSREIVSVQMNRLRRLGLIRYSRRHLDVCPDALLQRMTVEGIHPPRASEEPRSTIEIRLQSSSAGFSS